MTSRRTILLSDLRARAIADGFVVLVVVGWWLTARRLPDFVLPGPWPTAKALAAFFYDPALIYHVAATGFRVVLSVILATIIGIALAILPFYLPITRDIIRERIQPFLNAMPSLGWAILGVIWFGVSDISVVFVQVAILIPFCFLNVSQGIDELDAEIMEMARSFSTSRRRVFWKIIIPSLLPYVIAALRMAYGMCWKIALISELFGAESGLGYVMLQAQVISDAATVIATCLVIVAMFVLGDFLVLRPLSRFVRR